MRGRGVRGWGVCMAGGVHGQGACVAGEVVHGGGPCMAGGCVWPGGACMAGDMAGQCTGGMHPTGMHSCLILCQ